MANPPDDAIPVDRVRRVLIKALEMAEKRSNAPTVLTLVEIWRELLATEPPGAKELAAMRADTALGMSPEAIRAALKGFTTK